jgi:hypothetical protein
MADEVTRPTLTGLSLGDPPERWEALGFSVVDGVIELAGLRLILGGAEAGISRWWLAGIDSADEIDGLPTTVDAVPRSEPVAVATTHPNGALELDHVVITTPSFDRTTAALEAHGMPLRRIREVGDVAGGTGFRQGFRRLGRGILELVEAKQMPDGPARFWGLVVILRDLGRLASQLDETWLGERKPAVQPGREIVTLRSAAGLGQPVAFMTPDPA